MYTVGTLKKVKCTRSFLEPPYAQLHWRLSVHIACCLELWMTIILVPLAWGPCIWIHGPPTIKLVRVAALRSSLPGELSATQLSIPRAPRDEGIMAAHIRQVAWAGHLDRVPQTRPSTWNWSRSFATWYCGVSSEFYTFVILHLFW